MIPIDSPDDSVKLVNTFANYVERSSNKLSPKEEIEISNRIEDLVDVTTYQFTGRRVFDTGYRQVETPVEEATMDDISLPDFEKTPQEKILPYDFRIRKKKINTDLIDKLKLPTMAIPTIPIAALALGGSALTSKATMMSLGALLLEMYAAFKDLKNFRTTKKPPTNPPSVRPKNKPPILKRWWEAIKGNKFASAIAEIFRRMYNNKVPDTIKNFLRLIAIDNPVATYFEAVKKTIEKFQKMKSWTAGQLDRFLDACKTFSKGLYQRFERALAKLLTTLARSAASAIPPQWLLDSKHVKNWMENSRVWKAAVQSLSKLKNFKPPAWMKKFLERFKYLPFVGVVLEAGLAALTGSAIEDSKEYDADGAATGQNDTLEQIRDDMEFSSEKSVWGNMYAGLNYLGGASNVVALGGTLGQIEDQASYFVKQRHDDIKFSIPRFQDYIKDRNRPTEQLGAEQLKMELEEYLDDGTLSQERYDEIISNPEFLNLAGEIHRYKLDVSHNLGLLETMLSNYRFSHALGYKPDKTRLFFMREGITNWWTDSETGLASSSQRKFLNRFERLKDEYYYKLGRQSFLRHFLKPDQSETSENFAQLFNPDVDLRSLNVTHYNDYIRDYQLDDISNQLKDLQSDHVIDPRLAETDLQIANVTQQGINEAAKTGDRISGASASLAYKNQQYEKNLEDIIKQDIVDALAEQGIVDQAAPISDQERAKIVRDWLLNKPPEKSDSEFPSILPQKDKPLSTPNPETKRMPGYNDKIPDSDGRIYAVPDMAPLIGPGYKVKRSGRYRFKINTSDGEVITSDLLMRKGLSITSVSQITRRIKELQNANLDKEALLSALRQLAVIPSMRSPNTELIIDVPQPEFLINE